MGEVEGERRRLRGGSGGDEEWSGADAAAAAGLVASGLGLGISAESIVGGKGGEVDRKGRGA